MKPERLPRRLLLVPRRLGKLPRPERSPLLQANVLPVTRSERLFDQHQRLLLRTGLLEARPDHVRVLTRRLRAVGPSFEIVVQLGMILQKSRRRVGLRVKRRRLLILEGDDKLIEMLSLNF